MEKNTTRWVAVKINSFTTSWAVARLVDQPPLSREVQLLHPVAVLGSPPVPLLLPQVVPQELVVPLLPQDLAVPLLHLLVYQELVDLQLEVPPALQRCVSSKQPFKS